VIDQDAVAYTDIHSHLVPGVDDGARTLEDTLASVERLTRLGIRKILTTPHLDGSLTKDPKALEARLNEVTAAWEIAADAIGRDFPEVTFKRGHEIMLDVPDVDFSDPRRARCRCLSESSARGTAPSSRTQRGISESIVRWTSCGSGGTSGPVFR
jgi:hypothetical protein